MAIGVGVSNARMGHGQGLDDEDPLPPAPADISELSLEDLLQMPIVESATRRKQSLYEAPMAVDVFEGEELINAGITSVAELLRRVPGVYVMQVAADRFNVGLRGVNGLANNRVLVLVNGRRLMELDHGSPAWQNFPVHVGEIERIEVMRGPGTTLYGADGINGVINIATKRPLDSAGFAGLFASGQAWLPDQPNDLRGARVSNLGNGYASYKVKNQAETLGLGLVAGWNHSPDWLPSDPSAVQLHGDFGYHLAGSFEWRPKPEISLFMDARHAETEGLRGAGDTLTTQRLFDYYSEQSVTLALRMDELLPNVSFSVNGDARRSREETKLYSQVRGLDPAGNATTDQILTVLDPENYRAHTVAQIDASLLNGREIISVAAESSFQRSLRFFGSTATEWYYAGVLQSETLLLREPRLLVNLGIRAEQVDLTMQSQRDVRYGNISPRASLIARIQQAHTVRLTLATAYRTPSIWELSDITHGQNAAPLPRNYYTRGNLALRPEEVRSLELGYRGRPRPWVRVDATAYYQQLKRPIQFLQTSIPLMFENAPNTKQMGIELGFKIRPHRTFGGHLAYAYTRTTNTEARDYPSQLIQVGGQLDRWGFHFTLDFNYVAHTHLTLMQSDLSGMVTNHLSTSAQTLLNARIGRDIFDGAAELFATGANTLAFFRARQSLVQFPSATADPIGAVILAGIRIRHVSLGGVR